MWIRKNPRIHPSYYFWHFSSKTQFWLENYNFENLRIRTNYTETSKFVSEFLRQKKLVNFEIYWPDENTLGTWFANLTFFSNRTFWNISWWSHFLNWKSMSHSLWLINFDLLTSTGSKCTTVWPLHPTPLIIEKP